MSFGFQRIIRAGFQKFWRNSIVSFSSVLVMTATLSVIISLVFLHALLNFSLSHIENNVDINVYFLPTALESDILDLRDRLGALPEVAEVTYISREQALVDFTDRHETDYLIIQALEELENNPLGATLNVRAIDPVHYGSIATFIESDETLAVGGTKGVEKINFFQNQTIIDRLGTIITATKVLGLMVTAFFVVIAMLIIFNTIRLAIYASRKEITTMRAVGADWRYIQGPFLVEGTLYGVSATVLTLALAYPATIWVGKHTESFFGGMDIFTYYMNNFPEIFLILLFSGVLLGVVSSMLAVQKYIKK